MVKVWSWGDAGKLETEASTGRLVKAFAFKQEPSAVQNVCQRGDLGSSEPLAESRGCEQAQENDSPSHFYLSHVFWCKNTLNAIYLFTCRGNTEKNLRCHHYKRDKEGSFLTVLPIPYLYVVFYHLRECLWMTSEVQETISATRSLCWQAPHGWRTPSILQN